MIDEIAKLMDDLKIGHLRVGPDIIGFTNSSSSENVLQGMAMVVNKQPIANVSPIAVNRDRSAIDEVQCHQRYELFWN